MTPDHLDDGEIQSLRNSNWKLESILEDENRMMRENHGRQSGEYKNDEAREIRAGSSNIAGRETRSDMQVPHARTRGASDRIHFATADQCTKAHSLVDCEEV